MSKAPSSLEELVLKKDLGSSLSNLFQAVTRSDEKEVMSLISKGVFVNMSSSDGYTPLHWACEVGSVKMVKLLIEQGADVNLGNEDTPKPYMVALAYEHEDVLKLLVENGALIDEQPSWFKVGIASRSYSPTAPSTRETLEKLLDQPDFYKANIVEQGDYSHIWQQLVDDAFIQLTDDGYMNHFGEVHVLADDVV